MQTRVYKHGSKYHQDDIWEVSKTEYWKTTAHTNEVIWRLRQHVLQLTIEADGSNDFKWKMHRGEIRKAIEADWKRKGWQQHLDAVVQDRRSRRRL